ncbi:MAG: ComEA family DNA-binding protein [Anaerotignum sp.]
MDNKEKYIQLKNKELFILSGFLYLFIIIFIFCIQEAKPIDIGTKTSPDVLEKSWSEDFELLAPGMMGKMNINFATLEDLEALPGVGKKTAEAIISYREKNGPFRSIDDIVNVSGIGIKKQEQMKNYITVK